MPDRSKQPALLPHVTSRGHIVRYVYCEDELEQVEAELTPRTWVLADPDAQRDAAEQELGRELFDYPPGSVQWLINPETGSAHLAVYRAPITPE